jgi:hypothetical protein
VKWVAPTDQFLEFGAEGWRQRRQFPGSMRNKNGAGSGVIYAHTGGDIGASTAGAGLSICRRRRRTASTLSSTSPEIMRKWDSTDQPRAMPILSGNTAQRQQL